MEKKKLTIQDRIIAIMGSGEFQKLCVRLHNAENFDENFIALEKIARINLDTFEQFIAENRSSKNEKIRLTKAECEQLISNVKFSRELLLDALIVKVGAGRLPLLETYATYYDLFKGQNGVLESRIDLIESGRFTVDLTQMPEVENVEGVSF